MLNAIRKLNESRNKESNLIKEQYDDYSDAEATHWELQRDAEAEDRRYQENHPESEVQTEDSDYTVINDVEVVVHSEDPEDMELTDEEKAKISQLIDDFRAEVSETAEFDKLHIYETNAKLDGKIGEYGLMFTLSTGDDTGLYINGQMLKIDENSLLILEKLGQYELKFSNTINDLLVRRRST
jgi:hypothetical protein